MKAPDDVIELLTVLRDEPVDWFVRELIPAEFLQNCGRHDLHGLVHAQINRSVHRDEWPSAIRGELARFALEETAREMLRREELAGVLDALATRGVRALLLKGTALAYTVYDTPIARPRVDTDLLIDRRHQAIVRAALEERGYVAPPYCADVFSQFEMTKTDEFGMVHVLDTHWKISTQPVFADVLTYEELWPRAVPVGALGAAAVALCAVDALLLACMHPVMHHRNDVRLLWVYDIHLLAAGLTPTELDEFARLAQAKKIAEICAHGLRLAHTMFETPFPAELLADLERQDRIEPSAEYLASERRWHHETIASLRALPRFGERVRLLRRVLLPTPQYMLGAYGLRGKPLGAWLLPALYLHRNVRGAWKILAGKK